RLLTNASIDPATEAGDLPLRYLLAECDGDYGANLRLEDLHAENGFVALDYDGAPLPSDHGGPARLVAPGLYFWKSAKWLRRLVLSPYDRKGFWERLGYHNYGDPWKQQRYRGVSADDHRTTLDTDLSRQIRRERLGR
ncbi:MAG: molybdopterin-dependent oxidoreductase, partial [Pseudomonadota bacterium]